jgi:hypothetical protein
VRLPWWEAEGVRVKKLGLEHFVSEHGTNIHLLSETHLEPGRTLSFANYVCHLTDCPTKGGATAFLVHRGIDHYAAPVSGLQHLEALAIHVVLANWSLKVVAAYHPHDP